MHLGPTSLPSLYSLLLLNTAKATENSVILDPCTGTASILSLAAHLGVGGLHLGCDITEKYFCGNKFDLMLNDLVTRVWKRSFVDCIITDLPYNIRTEAVSATEVQDEDFGMMFKAIITLAGHVLVPGGRLCFWLNDLGEDVHKRILLAISDQLQQGNIEYISRDSDSCRPFARILWIFQKQGTQDLSKPKVPTQILDENILDLCTFRLENDPSGPGTLFAAIRANDLSVLKATTLSTSQVLALRDKYGKSLFHHAAGYSSLEIVKYLLDLGFDVNERAGREQQNGLMIASRFGRIDIVEYLLVKGADIRLRDKNGKTAMMLAAGFGHVKTLQRLVEGTEKEDLGECLKEGCRYGHLEIARVLIAKMQSLDCSIAAFGPGLIEAFK